MRIIHRIWMGKPMPSEYVDFGKLWTELNPDYELHDWTEEEILDTKWHNQQIINRMHTESQMPGADMVAYYTHLADVIDYELLYRHGGWYFNADIRPIKPLSLLRQYSIENTPALAMEDDIWPVNMAMWSPTINESLYGDIIEAMSERYFNNPGAFMNYSTGCGLIKQVLDTNKHHPVLLPRNVFNPIHWSSFDYGTTPNHDIDYPEETIATHLWHHRTNQRGQRILENWG